MYYYEIGLGVEKRWKTSVFTYEHPADIQIGTLVRVPFGNSKRTGIVLRRVKKPDFALKSIEKIQTIIFSERSLKFMTWYIDYYAADEGLATAQFLPKFLTASPKPLSEKPVEKVVVNLNEQQKKAISEIGTTPRPSVLHGVTGSGKTRIYAKLLAEVLTKKQNGLLLLPEIALTPQIIQELERYVPVIVYHSGMTDAERSKSWYSVATAVEPFVVVGPRSALFLPYQNLGLIIVDEAHDSSYKQESDVRYNGLFAAAGLATAHNAKLLLGSATPPITETEYILENGGNLVCLHDKALDSSHKDIQLVDMRERDKFSRSSLISDKLLGEIEATLKRDAQIMLFINRRGTAKLMLCDACGWQAVCSRCDLPLTLHHDIHALLCHTCGQRQKVPHVCPECGRGVTLRSLGSKAVVDEVVRLFPDAKISRFDSDSKDEESFHKNFQAVRDGEIDILIGTQQLVKGLDLPKLTLLGILNADLSLHFPDFSSDERTFQLITQAMGRVGRGHKDGMVILQTFQPDNPILKNALSEDWHAFRESELPNREKHLFPPYMFYAKAIFREKSYQLAEKKAGKAQDNLRTSGLHADGPLPSFYAKRGNFFYVQLHVRSKKRTKILKGLREISKEALIDFDPLTLL